MCIDIRGYFLETTESISSNSIHIFTVTGWSSNDSHQRCFKMAAN